MIVQPVPWTRQPQTTVGINPQWASGIACAWNLTDIRDVVSNKQPNTVAATMVRSVTNNGKYIQSAGAAAGAIQYDGWRPVTDYARHSYLFISSARAETGIYKNVFSQRHNGSGLHQVVVGFNYNPTTGANQNGTLYLFEYETSLRFGAAVTSVCDGNVHGIAICRDGSTARCAVDGVTRTVSTTGTGEAFAHVNMKVGVAQSADHPSNSNYHNDPLYMVVVWNRALSADELITLSAKPWQVFMPLKRRLWVNTSAAPALPTLSASTYKPGTLTADGWQPRVTAS